MTITVKKMNTDKTSLINIMHAILNLTTYGDCVTCSSVVQYLYNEAHYQTYTAEISTILKLLTEMGFFTVEYGIVKGYSKSITKIYTRTHKINEIY